MHEPRNIPRVMRHFSIAIPAIASLCYADIERDHPCGCGDGVRALFDPPGDDGWAAIGAWVRGLSRAMDYLETDPQIDANRVAVMSHFRLGQTPVRLAVP